MPRAAWVEAVRLESLLLLQLRDEKLVLVRDRHARDRAEEGEVRLRGLREGPPRTPSPAGRPLRSQARAAQAGPQAEERASEVGSLRLSPPVRPPLLTRRPALSPCGSVLCAGSRRTQTAKSEARTLSWSISSSACELCCQIQ